MKAKVMAWLLTWFIFAQSTLISYHKEASFKTEVAYTVDSGYTDQESFQSFQQTYGSAIVKFDSYGASEAELHAVMDNNSVWGFFDPLKLQSKVMARPGLSGSKQVRLRNAHLTSDTFAAPWPKLKV